MTPREAPRRLFGTNGVRGVVGSDMAPELAMRLGRAIGATVSSSLAFKAASRGNRHGQVKRKPVAAIGMDARTSGPMLVCAVSAGIQASGCDVVELGIATTPAVQYFVKRGSADIGVVVTASHNPPEFNGIKCISHDGTEMSRDEEERVEKAYWGDLPSTAWHSAGASRVHPGVCEEYARGVLAQIDVGASRVRNLKAVIDCANGAGSAVGPRIVEALCPRTVSVNCHMSGAFPGHPSEPTEENLADLRSLVLSSGADIGVAMDGDADRAVFFDERGRFVTGDKVLALLGRAAARKKKGAVVVTPVSTSSVVEEVVVAEGGRVEYTRVGAPIVSRRMMEIGADFGGEENGGMIFPAFQHCRDAGMTAASLIELIAMEGVALGEMVDGLPKRYTCKTKVACPDSLKDAAMARFRDGAAGRVDLTDGVKAYTDDGWVLVRKSGTEPIIRIYSEAGSIEVAESQAKSAAARLERAINE